MSTLKGNNINSIVVESAEEAKQKVLELIPEKAEIMTMTSTTLESIGLDKEINESGRYNAVKPILYSLNRETHAVEMQKMGAAPEWSIGSVHAITEDGRVIVASNSGSQLPGYAYGSLHVIWVVGTQKIVSDLEAGMKRIHEYVLPLESVRVQKAYGMKASNVSKLLIFNKETVENRITVIFVKEKLGY